MSALRGRNQDARQVPKAPHQLPQDERAEAEATLAAALVGLARLLGRQAARESGPASDPQMELSDEQDAPPTR